MATPIKIYKDEQHNCYGRIGASLSLSYSPIEIVKIRNPGTEMEIMDLVEGGYFGTILAPEGSVVDEVAGDGRALFTPGSFFGISADEAWDLAKREQIGFRFPES